MREGPGRSAGNRVGESGGASLRNDNAVCAGGERRADDGAEVVRVFNAVEQDDETALIFGGVGASEDVVESGGSTGGGDGDHTLMIAGVGKAVEIGAIFEADGNLSLAGELDDFFDAGILAALGDDNAVEVTAGLEGFAHGVNASETVHGRSLQSSANG